MCVRAHARQEQNMAIMFNNRVIVCMMVPRVYYIVKNSACMPQKRTGMNVENRSTVFAKCVEIAPPQCGEREFSVLAAGLLTA